MAQLSWCDDLGNINNKKFQTDGFPIKILFEKIREKC